MKRILSLVFLIVSSFSFAQIAANGAQNCADGEFVCNDNGTTFDLSTGQGSIDDLPAGSNISNPSTNPGAAGNSGCLLSGELNPNWFVISIGTDGDLEFTIGFNGNTGFYDWALWPYYTDASGVPISCTDLINNSLPPVACNWNGSSSGYTGMYQQGSLPAGGQQVNFEYSIPVLAGEQYVLCFSNYSGLSGNVPLTFGNDIPGNTNPNSAGVTCTPETPDQTICLGEVATVNINPPPTVTNPSYNWLVTTGVSDPTSGVDVQVNITNTTEYHVEIFDNGSYVVTDTFTIYIQSPHTTFAGNDDVFCLGDPIMLSGTPSDPVNNTVQWSVDASQVSPAPFVFFTPSFQMAAPTANVDQPGVYEFIFSETNNVCGTVTDTVEILVSEQTLTATSTSPSCAGYNDGVISINAPDAIEYSFDGGSTWGPNNSDNVFSANTYNVCAKNIYGCVTCVNTVVTEPAPVIISVSNDTLICQNGTAYISASATGGTSYDFHWSQTSNTNANQSVNPIGDSIFTVYATNEFGCPSNTLPINVTVRAPLTGNISPWDTICPGYPTDLWADVTGGIGTPYTFTWSTSEIQTGANNQTINVNPPATTTYTVTITDECESTPLVMETKVRVAPLPVPQYTVLNPNQCEPAKFDVVNSTTSSMSQYVYWLVDGQKEFINQDTITTQSFMAGDYDFQMIVTSYEGCIDSLTFEDALHVIESPTANFIHSPNPVRMFDTEVSFTNTSILGIDHQWYFESGSPSISTEEDPVSTFPDGEEGSYTVTLITTSELGCTDTLNYELIVFSDIIIFAPNTFTPDGDEHNQNWGITMKGIDEYNFEILVFNRWGQIVWESHNINEEWDGTYNGKLVDSGTYAWVIRTKDLLEDTKYTYNGTVTIIR